MLHHDPQSRFLLLGTARSEEITLDHPLILWQQLLGRDGRSETRGQVKHILTGETTYFREWSSLLAFLQQKLEADVTSNTN